MTVFATVQQQYEDSREAASCILDVLENHLTNTHTPEVKRDELVGQIKNTWEQMDINVKQVQDHLRAGDDIMREELAVCTQSFKEAENLEAATLLGNEARKVYPAGAPEIMTAENRKRREVTKASSDLRISLARRQVAIVPVVPVSMTPDIPARMGTDQRMNH